MNVPFLDLRREYAALEPELQSAVTRVMESGWFVLGDEVEDFESDFASYVGSAHGIGTNSGSDALELALRAVGVGEGDEVITVSHTFVATANAIVQTGADPVFVDIDPETYCMDVKAVESKLTERTAAIIPVHLYGRPMDLDPLLSLAESYDLAIVEDACQAHGATVDGERVGSLGDVGCFSFYPVKNLGAYGDGGMAVTDDPEVAERIRTFRNIGQTDRYEHPIVGVNSRLDEIQAAILGVKLPHLEDWNGRRRAVADRYRAELRDLPLELPPAAGSGAKHAYHLFVVRTPERDALQAHLDDAGVDTLIHYPTPVHQQAAYDHVDVSLPETEALAAEILSLPIHPWIEESEVTAVVEAVRSFYER